MEKEPAKSKITTENFMAKFDQINSKFQLQFCFGWCACVCGDCLVATTTFTFKINSIVKTNNFGRESASSRTLRRAWKAKKCSIRSWTNVVTVVAMRLIQMDRVKIFNMFFRWTFRVDASPHRRHSSEHWNCKTIIRIGNEVNRVILSWLWAGRVNFLFIIFHLGELQVYEGEQRTYWTPACSWISIIQWKETKVFTPLTVVEWFNFE